MRAFQPFLRTEGELGSRSEHCAAAYCSLLALHRLSVASMKAVLAREGREGESKNFLDSVFFQGWKKTESGKFLDSGFFQTISPPCLGLCFFSELKNGKCSSYPFLQLFRTRLLDTH